MINTPSAQCPDGETRRAGGRGGGGEGGEGGEGGGGEGDFPTINLSTQ